MDRKPIEDERGAYGLLGERCEAHGRDGRRSIRGNEVRGNGARRHGVGIAPALGDGRDELSYAVMEYNEDKYILARSVLFAWGRAPTCNLALATEKARKRQSLLGCVLNQRWAVPCGRKSNRMGGRECNWRGIGII